MPSLSTLLQENLKSNALRNDKGFSLLEVIVALLIMAGGFLAVVNLLSGSVRSVDLSSQYLKAVTLANSKMNELEIENFYVDDKSGRFHGAGCSKKEYSGVLFKNEQYLTSISVQS